MLIHASLLRDLLATTMTSSRRSSSQPCAEIEETHVPHYYGRYLDTLGNPQVIGASLPSNATCPCKAKPPCHFRVCQPHPAGTHTHTALIHGILWSCIGTATLGAVLIHAYLVWTVLVLFCEVHHRRVRTIL